MVPDEGRSLIAAPVLGGLTGLLRLDARALSFSSAWRRSPSIFVPA
jgi:hypothetical protein